MVKQGQTMLAQSGTMISYERSTIAQRTLPIHNESIVYTRAGI